MDLYVVMVNDRHTDPEPWLFSSEDVAMAYARRVARDWLVEQVGGADGWLFHAQHPTEGDAIWVTRKTVDDRECRL